MKYLGASLFTMFNILEHMLSIQKRISPLDTFLSSVYLDGLILSEKSETLQKELSNLKKIYHQNSSINELQHRKDLFPDIEHVLGDFYGKNIETLKADYFKDFFHIWQQNDDSVWLGTTIVEINEDLIEMLSDKNTINIIKNLNVSNPKSINDIVEMDSSKATFYRKMADLITYGFIHIYGISVHSNGKKTMFTKTFDQINLKINENVELRLKLNNTHLQSSIHISKIMNKLNRPNTDG